jgi:hypothetical protein
MRAGIKEKHQKECQVNSGLDNTRGEFWRGKARYMSQEGMKDKGRGGDLEKVN